MRRLVALLVFLSAVTCTLLSMLWFWGGQAVDISEPKTVELMPSTGLWHLSQSMHSKGLISYHPGFFYAWTRIFGDFRRYQAGLYKFERSTTPQQIADKMLRGDIFVPIQVQFTIPEGFSLKMIAPRLAANGAGTEQEIRRLWIQKDFLKQLGVPSSSFEGYFYPATYSFTKKISAREAISEGVKKFWSSLPKDYEKNINAKGMSLKDAVTFASLIEIETRRDDERSKVSEVIWARLKNGEPLAIDAALIYGIVDYRGDITWAHLKDKKNRYNTRIHKGLPPTPIGSPSRKSLEAVLNPTNEGYYYYVRDFDSKDAHIFSHSLAEHNRHVSKLVAKTKKKSGVKPSPSHSPKTR